MTDLQLDDLGNRRNGSDIRIGQAMSGVHFESQGGGLTRAVAQRFEMARNPRFVVHKPRGQGFIIGQR